MTIASEITRIKNNIAGAYTALSAKGATMPATQNSANLATTVASVPAGGTTLTVTNNSSYNRVIGEKVWLNKSGDDWEIINYGNADIYSITAKCDENIAIGATGSVTLADDGNIINHLARDFVLGGNTTEANVDDAGQLLTYDFNGTGSEKGCFIISNILDYTPESFDNARVRLTFKLIDLSENQDTDLNALEIYLGYLTNATSTAWNPPDSYRKGNYQMLSGKFQAEFYDSNTSSQKLQVDKNVGSLLKWNDWMRFTMTYINSYKGSNLYIGNLATSTSNTTWGGYGMNRNYGNVLKFFIGLNNAPVGAKFRLIFDLSQCNITDSNNVIRWQPYKETEG